MPTLYTINGFQFGFVSFDCSEPAHVHVTKGDAYAKIWLAELNWGPSSGFKRQEKRAIKRIMREKQDDFLREFAAFCINYTPVAPAR